MKRPDSSQGMTRLPSYMRTSTAALASARLPRSELVPQEFLARNLKEKRQFRLLSRKLTVFVTFVTIYIAVLLLDRNISGRSIVRGIIANDLLQTSRATSGITYYSINSVATFWDWFANSFMEVVYGLTDSNGLVKRDDERYTIASHTLIVGGFHLFQQRYAAVNISSPTTKGDQCYSTLAPVQGLQCYTKMADSLASYGYTNGSAASQAQLLSLDMFNYSTSTVTDSSGFQTLFLRSTSDGDDEKARVALMQQFRWIDRQTRSVEIAMTLYNRNLKLWSVVHLTVVFDLAGGVTPKASIHVTNLEPYDMNNTRNVVRVVLEILFVIHVIYFFILELWDVCVLSGGSLKVYMARYGIINNLGDWGNVVTNSFICIWRYQCQSNATRTRLLSIQSFEEYVPALTLVLWDDILLAINICNVLLLTARTLKYFQVTNGGRRLMNSVYGAMPEVFSFLPIYLSVTVGYTFAGHMLYGLSFREWATFPRALFRVFELNFGLYDPGPIYDAGGYLSAIFIYSANVVFCILMLNVFMAIVMSTWENLSDKETEKAAERKQFSRPMTVSDMVHLVLMREDVVDTLLDIAVDLEGTERVSLSVFTKEWESTGMEISPKTWERITNWYWDSTAPPSTSKDAAGCKLIDRLQIKKPRGSLEMIEATDDIVEVIHSGRDLNMPSDDSGSSQTKPKDVDGPAKRYWQKPSSSRVAADLSEASAPTERTE